MVYTSNMINTSATIVGKAASAITDPRGKAIKFDSNGKLVLASTAGEAFMGVGIVTNDEAIAAGQDIDVQVKDMGLGLAGGAISAGDALATDANGKLVTATAGDFAVGFALADATSGSYVRLQIAKHYVPAE